MVDNGQYSLLMVINGKYTIRLFNIAMENHHF